jgi:hypothetical protein
MTETRKLAAILAADVVVYGADVVLDFEDICQVAVVAFGPWAPARSRYRPHTKLAAACASRPSAPYK